MAPRRKEQIPFDWGDHRFSYGDFGGSSHSAWANIESRPNGINGDLDGLHRTPSNASHTLHIDCQNNTYKSKDNTYSNGVGDDTKGRAPRSRDPYSLAAQIMFLPQEIPEEGLQAWGSYQDYMDPEGYHHPVLVLTDPDEEGYVVVQKMTSFGGNKLIEQFPDPRDADKRASYMQIYNGESDKDAGAILHLSPQPENWRSDHDYLRKRSYVETNVSYRCREDILLPYHFENPYDYIFNKKYFLRNDSYWKVLDRVLLLRVSEGNGPKRGRAGAFGSKRFNPKQEKSGYITTNNSCASLPFKDTPSTSLVSLPRAMIVPDIPRKNTVSGPPPETPPTTPTRMSRKGPRTTPKKIISDVAKSVGSVGSALLRMTPGKKSKKVLEAEPREEADREEK